MMALPALASADVLSNFELPSASIATSPPEARSLARDEVKLLVASPAGLSDRNFLDLTRLLRSGDLLVVNNSQTLPAAVDLDSRVVHVSTSLPGGLRIVELRERAGHGTRRSSASPDTKLALPGGAQLEVLAPYPIDSPSRRLWVAHLGQVDDLHDYLRKHGRAITYTAGTQIWPIYNYQTIFARVPGSAEMPSAGRPFSHRLVADLIASGVAIAPISLHTGVSSLETGEDPITEWFEVPRPTADAIAMARERGSRVVAVGTTVIRALATTADDSGTVHPGQGWTDLVIEPDSRLRMIDGLITGWHEPRSSHLDMLRAVADPDLLDASYSHALGNGYLWHEFGDSHLILR